MLMILIAHIIIAITSLVLSSLSFLKPSQAKIKGSYIMLALTMISGTVLVYLTPGHILESCLVGLAYVGTTLVLVISANRKLATEKFNRRYLHNDGL